MEEVGRRLQEPSSPSQTPATVEAAAAAAAPAAALGEEEDEEMSSPKESPSTPESSDTSSCDHSPDTVSEVSEVEWSFSFEQVLASLLNEPAIVNFFERPVNIQAKLAHAKVAQLKQKVNKRRDTWAPRHCFCFEKWGIRKKSFATLKWDAVAQVAKLLLESSKKM